MASLDKLSIMGIRSFSPREDQVIQFYNPLTLILGPNGTGKTTIIECLRYISAGDMPPNSKTNCAFIHDPKIAKETEVKARIKLKFCDTRGKTLITTRNISAIQKQKKLEMRTLEGSIGRVGDDGKLVSMGSKCADLEREMVTCLGVSKAILNNVIFCHQEDSNWPLSEGKMLKAKFDEIFAATRYIKALESIQKIRQLQDGAVRVYSAELKYLTDNKKQAAEMKLELEKYETKLAASKDLVKHIEEKLQPILNRLKEIRSKETIIGRIQLDLSKKETEINIVKKTCKDLERSVISIFEGSTDELRQELRSFTRRLEDQMAERQDVDQTLKNIMKEAPHLSVKKTDILIKLGKLRTEMEQHKERVGKRDKMAKILCEKSELSIILCNEQLTDSQVKEVLTELDICVSKKKADHEGLKNKYLLEEKGLQAKLDNLRDAKTKLLQTETIRNKQITDNQNEIRTIHSKLVDAETSASRLHHIEETLKIKEQELEDALKELDVPLIQSELKELQDESNDLNAEIRKLESEMMELHKLAEARTELDIAQKDKAAKEELIRKLKAKHEESLKHLLGKMPFINICSTVDQFVLQLNREMEQLHDRQGKLHTQRATYEAERKRNREDLKKKECELEECKESLFQTCGNKDLEASIAVVENLLKNMQEENGSLTGTQYLYNVFLNKLKQQDACCPLCHRGFSESKDVDDLIEELNTKLRFFPDEVKSKQKTLQIQQDKYNSMLILRPVKAKIEVLKVEIPDLRMKIDHAEENINKCDSELSEMDEIMMIKQGDRSLTQSMHSDLVLMDQTVIELSKIEQRIAASKLLGDVSSRTVAVVNQEKMNNQTKLDDIQKSIMNKQQQLTSYLKKTQSLQAEVNKLGAEQLQISRSVQQIAELEKRKALLLNEITAFQKEIENVKNQLRPFQDKIVAAQKEKEDFFKTKDHSLEDSMQAIRQLQLKIDELSIIHRDVSRFLDSQRPELLHKCQKDLDNTEQQLKRLEDKKLELSEKLRILSEELDNHQTKVRNLKDNYELRQKQEQIQILEQDVIELKTRLGGFDINTIQKKKSDLEKDEKKCTAERNKAEGQQHELEESIRKMNKELNEERFRDAEQLYKEKLIKSRTTAIASSDLIKYSTALDGAIMQYHSLKMTEINKIIKDLWSSTYRGNDIDYIAIRSDSDEGKISTGSKRRVYHYRVVMIKGDIEHDMRGRCSAGQKVLASLIIRLALAETFCMNCGILALDEPTTNLDQDNIESLAEALARIVRSRLNSGHRNFQLIVITHDEDFVERLGRAEFVDYYYRIGKNDNGHSTVMKYHVQSLP